MYKVSFWKINEFVGEHAFFNTLTEAHFFFNRCGALYGYIENADGEIIEEFGDR